MADLAEKRSRWVVKVNTAQVGRSEAGGFIHSKLDGHRLFRVGDRWWVAYWNDLL